MSEAPDFSEAVVGYRAWHVDEDGLLRPWTFTGLPWAQGVNDAICARAPHHRPPVSDCMCGIYALTDPSDRRLNFRGDQVVGAIAAWGDMEVHRTGFRAQHACVVALAAPRRVDPETERRLELAARRYDVPIVEPGMLSLEARSHGSPLPDDLFGPPIRVVPRMRSAVPTLAPDFFAAPSRGIALDAHLWVETSLGAVVVGLTRELSRLLGTRPTLSVVEPGTAVRAGDRLATLTASPAASPLAVWAPVSGRVLAVNPKLAEDPTLLARDPEGAGWLVRVAPGAWEEEGSAVTWGPAAARHYAACLARDAARGAAFADVRIERLKAMPRVRDGHDVVARLREEAARPRFADAADIDARLATQLRAVLRRDVMVRSRIAALARPVAFRLSEPEATLVIDPADASATVVATNAPVEDALELRCSTETAHSWFTGALDPAAAVRAGDLTSDAPAADVLHALAILKHLRVAPAPRRPSWSPR